MSYTMNAARPSSPSRALGVLNLLLVLGIAVNLFVPVLFVGAALFGKVTLSDPSSAPILETSWSMIRPAALALGRLYALWVTWAIVRDLRLAQPFHVRTPARLRSLAALCLLYWIYGLGSSFIHISGNTISGSVGGTFSLKDLTLPPELLVSLCLFALAEVFRHGLTLRQDQDLTV